MICTVKLSNLFSPNSEYLFPIFSFSESNILTRQIPNLRMSIRNQRINQLVQCLFPEPANPFKIWSRLKRNQNRKEAKMTRQIWNDNLLKKKTVVKVLPKQRKDCDVYDFALGYILSFRNLQVLKWECLHWGIQGRKAGRKWFALLKLFSCIIISFQHESEIRKSMLLCMTLKLNRYYEDFKWRRLRWRIQKRQVLWNGSW